MKQLTLLALVAVLSVFTTNVEAAPQAKAGLNLDHTSITALAPFTFESSEFSIVDKAENGGVTRNLTFKKGTSKLTISYIVIQDSSKTPNSVIESEFAGQSLSTQQPWSFLYLKDTTNHTTLGDSRYCFKGGYSATAIKQNLGFSRSNIVVFVGSSDSNFDLKPLAIEIDGIINALPNINYSDIGNHKPTLTLTQSSTTIGTLQSESLTTTTTDPNNHVVITEHDQVSQEGLHLAAITGGYSVQAAKAVGPYTVKIVAINAIGLFVEKTVTFTVN